MDSNDLNRVAHFSELYNNMISKFNMKHDIDRAKYGRTTDATICQNLFILCPDVDYELSRNKNIRDIVDWLVKYNKYGMILFDQYKERLDLETTLIIDNISLIEKTKKFDMNKMNTLPEDILNTIWSYLPMKEKGICILGSDWWSDKTKRLMKLKQKELVHLSNNMRIYYNKIYNRWGSGPHMSGYNFNSKSFEKIQNLEKDYIYNMKKIDIINWLGKMIILHLNIELRDKNLRGNVIKGGFYCLILIDFYLKKKEGDRLLLEENRKSIKKDKRKDRENSKKRQK